MSYVGSKKVEPLVESYTVATWSWGNEVKWRDAGQRIQTSRYNMNTFWGSEVQNGWGWISVAFITHCTDISNHHIEHLEYTIFVISFFKRE
jgi:hypothetical protein